MSSCCVELPLRTAWLRPLPRLSNVEEVIFSRRLSQWLSVPWSRLPFVQCHPKLIIRFLEAAATTPFSGEAPRNSCSWFVDIKIIFPRCNPYLHRTRETPPTKPCGPLLLALTLPRLASKLSQRVVPWSLRWVVWNPHCGCGMWQYPKLPTTG